MTPTLEALDAPRASKWAPPATPRSKMEFSRSMILPDGPHAGTTWEPSTEPAQELTIKEMDDGRYRIFVSVWPSQRGKTLNYILMPTLHALIEQRTSVAYVMPNMDKLSQNWEGKIKPSIIGTGFGAWLPSRGPGSKGGRPASLTFRDPKTNLSTGLIYFMALGTGGRETSTSSVSPSTVLIDEADDAEDAGQIKLTCKRIEAWGTNGRVYISSTVNDRTDRTIHPVLDFHAQGTKTRLAHRCPHCSRHVVLEWECVDLDSARVCCPDCGVLWSEDDRHHALNDSVLTHEAPDSDIFSFLCTGLDFHMGNLTTMVREYKEAKEAEARYDYGLMKTFSHKVLCRPYVPPSDEVGAPNRLSTSYMEARSMGSDYAIISDDRAVDGDSKHLAECPDWVEWLVAAVDVQKGGDKAPGRGYWLIQGWNGDGRTADLGWGHKVMAPQGRYPSESELHQGLNAIDILITEYARSIGKTVVRRGVDVGDRQDEIVRWILSKAGYWWPVKGSEGSGANMKVMDQYDRGGWIYRRAQQTQGHPWNLWLIEVHHVRQQAQGGFMVPPGNPGAAHLPRGLKRDATLLRHYCATALIADEKGKVRWSEKKEDRKFHHEWQSRRDFLDCRTYCIALGHHHHITPPPMTRTLVTQQNYQPTGSDDGDISPVRIRANVAQRRSFINRRHQR